LKDIILAMIEKFNWKIATVWAVVGLVVAGVLNVNDLISLAKFAIGKII